MNINKIALGTVQFGLNYGISNNQGQTDIQEVKKILEYCQIVGINTLDSASVYGESEEVLGKVGFQEFNIISKFISSDVNELSKEFSNSLMKLGKTKLYAYLAHRPLKVLKNRDLWMYILDKKQKGVIKKIGFSIDTIDELNQVLDAELAFDIIQIPFNYFDSRFKSIAQQLKIRGVEIHSRSTFLQGLFFMDMKKIPVFFNEVKEIIRKLQLKYGENLPNVLLEYVLRHNFIDKVVIGVNSKEQLVSNISDVVQASLNGNIEIKNERIIIPSQW